MQVIPSVPIFIPHQNQSCLLYRYKGVTGHLKKIKLSSIGLKNMIF